MPNENVNIHVKMAGAREAAAESKTLGRDIRGVGTAADSTGRGFRRASGEAARHRQVLGSLRTRIGALTASYRGAAKSILAAGVAFGSYEGIKKATQTTVELGSTTLKLSRNLGLTTRAASEWAAVAHVRHIDSKALNMSFTTLSRNVESAKTQYTAFKQKVDALGNSQADQKKRHDLLNSSVGKQADMFRRLGISQGDLIHGSRDFQGLMLQVADGFGKLRGGTQRQAAAQALLGRSYQTILPLFKSGGETLKEQIALAEKYGATFGNTTAEKIKNFIKAQHEAEFATLGLQVAIGTKVVPVVTKAINAFAKFIAQWREGKGRGGEFRQTVMGVANAAKPVVLWFARAARNVARFAGHHPGLVKIATALFLASRALKIMRFGGAISGAFRLYKILKSIVAARFGATIARDIVTKIGGVPGRLGGLRGAFGTAGRALGTAFGIGFLFTAGDQINNWFKNTFGANLPNLGFNLPRGISDPLNPVPAGSKHGPWDNWGQPTGGPPVTGRPRGGRPHPGGVHGGVTPGRGTHKIAVPQGLTVPQGALAGATPQAAPDIHVFLDGRETTRSTARWVQNDRNRR